MSHMPTGPQPATSPAPWPPAPTPERDRSQLLAVVGVVLGLLGLIVGVAAWFRAAPASVAYSSQEIAAAKSAVCEAHAKTNHMLKENKAHAGGDETEALISAVNTRFAIHAAGSYLTQTVDRNPALSTELKEKVERLASAFAIIAIDQVSAADRSALDIDYKAAELSSENVFEMCR